MNASPQIGIWARSAMRRQGSPPVNRLKHGVERECTAILLRQKAQIARCFKDWPDPSFQCGHPSWGVSLDALKFLHLEQRIPIQGHEPLDTGSTPTPEGEPRRMHNGRAQAEDVTNLDKVPPAGALLAIGVPKSGGSLGGYARFTAVCPSAGKHGVCGGEVAEAALPKSDRPLTLDPNRGLQIRR